MGWSIILPPCKFLLLKHLIKRSTFKPVNWLRNNALAKKESKEQGTCNTSLRGTAFIHHAKDKGVNLKLSKKVVEAHYKGKGLYSFPSVPQCVELL